MEEIEEHGNGEDILLKNVKFNRFQVKMVEGQEATEEELTKLHEEPKSSRYNMTREALPRLDNYRNIMSIQAAYRPTLDDLHNALTLNAKIKPTLSDVEKEVYPFRQQRYDQEVQKYGWVQGVLIPNLLNMCGALIFLRFSWIMAQTGFVEGILMILCAGLVSILTALSISAIGSNGLTKEGGCYVMMSRSLGPEFGAPIGLILLIAHIGLCVLYALGIAEYFSSVFDFCWLDCSRQNIRSLACVILFIVICMAVLFYSSSSAVSTCVKAQMLLIVMVLAAFIDFLLGAILGPPMPQNETSSANLVPFSMNVLTQHLIKTYQDKDSAEYRFFGIFSIFYLAASDFLSGINFAGNLKDPLKSIPKGTILSVFMALVVYLAIAVIVSGTVIEVNYTGPYIHNITSLHVANCFNNTFCHNTFIPMYLIDAIAEEKVIIRIATLSLGLSCSFTNCLAAVSSIKMLCLDVLYPKPGRWINHKSLKPLQAYVFTVLVAVAFVIPGDLNIIAPVISVLLLAAYAVINLSIFHISLIRPVGWRPTFKLYNMWISLMASVFCLCLMFLISWIISLIAVISLIAIYMIVSYEKPDVNWGSSSQAQTYSNALLSVYSLSHVMDHVKNYRPQVLVLSGHPSHRPPLVTFAHLITKNLSLMICGHIHKIPVSQTEQLELSESAQNWLDAHRIKCFYTQVDDMNFENGAKSLLQASGLGKLKPNILLMGYQNNWTKNSKSNSEMYFNTIHKALDSHLAVAILRVKYGMDFSSLMVDNNQLSQTISRMGHAKPTAIRYDDPTVDWKEPRNDKSNHIKTDSYEDVSVGEIYRSKDGYQLTNDMLARVTQFQGRQKKGTIDVWWLYDDGGLTLLLPYIISTRRCWSNCKLRVFALSNDDDTLEFEQRNMASLLAKFRIEYSDLTVFTQLMKKPQEETISFYENLIKQFKHTDENNDRMSISDSELLEMQEKTNKHLRLRELLLENSQDANLVVMTLPIPRKCAVSAVLYMSWLEALTQGMPPFLLVRGNQTSVLTFYS